MIRNISLNIQTLYADLLQSADIPDDVPATIKRKTVRGRPYLYASIRSGTRRTEHYIGPEEDEKAQAQAKNYQRAEARAKARRSTVAMLRRAHMLAPPPPIGRVFEVLSREGLFSRGLTLVGTHAFRLYPLHLGVTWPGAAFATNDIDISAAAFAEAGDPVDLAEVFKGADPELEIQWYPGSDQLPARFRLGEVTIDILTRAKRGGRSPIEIQALGVAGEAVPFQEYLTEQALEVIALHGAGVRVRVPDPARYAVHKLIVSQRRPGRDPKIAEDLEQASALIRALTSLGFEHDIDDAIEDARQRGRSWRAAVNAGLAAIEKEAGSG